MEYASNCADHNAISRFSLTGRYVFSESDCCRPMCVQSGPPYRPMCVQSGSTYLTYFLAILSPSGLFYLKVIW